MSGGQYQWVDYAEWASMTERMFLYNSPNLASWTSVTLTASDNTIAYAWNIQGIGSGLIGTRRTELLMSKIKVL